MQIPHQLACEVHYHCFAYSVTPIGLVINSVSMVLTISILISTDIFVLHLMLLNVLSPDVKYCIPRIWCTLVLLYYNSRVLFWYKQVEFEILVLR